MYKICLHLASYRVSFIPIAFTYSPVASLSRGFSDVEVSQQGVVFGTPEFIVRVQDIQMPAEPQHERIECRYDTFSPTII